MNEKDLSDLGDAIYWLAAVRADLEALKRHDPPMRGIFNALRCLSEAELAVERVALGHNRALRGLDPAG